MLQLACGEDYLSCKQCHEWHQHFISARTSTEDNPKSRQPYKTMLMEDNHNQKVHAVIRENCHLTLHEVSEEAGSCKSSCHTILTK